jgi:phospholipid-binding lipoprotein MlaA
MQRRKTKIKTRPLCAAVTIALALSACATTLKQAQQSDPWQDWNKSTQAFNDDFDKHILKPVAVSYLHVTNKAVDDGVTNFFNNINDINVSINDIFQFKFLQCGSDISRFLINSTAGLGGIFDWASRLDLPKHKEDFGQTLAVWQIPSGPYLVLPFMGPSTPRETLGLLGDALLDPMTYISIFGGFPGFIATAATTALDIADYRAGLMSKEKVVNEADIGDRYDFIKDSYLQHREFLIYDGNPPNIKDPLDNKDNDF